MTIKKIKKYICGKHFLRIAAGALWISLCITLPVCANGAASITAKFAVLQEIVSNVVSSIGTIIVLWGLFEFGNSMQTQEGGAQSQAMKRIGGGLVMVIAPQLLILFK